MKYKIGFTCGTFDLCHAGHMLMFEEVKYIPTLFHMEQSCFNVLINLISLKFTPGVEYTCQILVLRFLVNTILFR